MLERHSYTMFIEVEAIELSQNQALCEGFSSSVLPLDGFLFILAETCICKIKHRQKKNKSERV